MAQPQVPSNTLPSDASSSCSGMHEVPLGDSIDTTRENSPSRSHADDSDERIAPRTGQDEHIQRQNTPQLNTSYDEHMYAPSPPHRHPPTPSPTSRRSSKPPPQQQRSLPPSSSQVRFTVENGLRPSPAVVHSSSPSLSRSFPSSASTSPSLPARPPAHLVNDLSGMKAAELTNAMIHLYRGEMSRQIAYRIRLDTCTNWAVTVTAALTVFSLGNTSIPHYFHLIICVFICIFLVLESRRYGYYIAVKSRVRQIECGFYGRVIMGDEFGRSICGLLPFQQPPGASLEMDVPKVVDAPVFRSPFMRPRQLHGPTAAEDAQRGTALEEVSALEQHRAAERQHIAYRLSSQADPAPSSLPTSRQSVTSSATSSTGSIEGTPPLILPHINDWTHILYHSLLYPEVNISMFDSVLTRLRRVYMLLLLGVLASWIIKVHLDIRLTIGSHIAMVCAVCVAYLAAAFLVWYYLPQKRSRMHAEKHVAAMFIQAKQRRVTGSDNDGATDADVKSKRRREEDTGLRRRIPQDAGEATSVQQSTPLPVAFLPRPHHMHPLVVSLPSGSIDDLRYWNGHARCNSEYDADDL